MLQGGWRDGLAVDHKVPAVIQVEGNLDGVRVLRHVQFRPEVAVLVQPLRVWLRVVDPLGAWEAFRQKAQAKEKQDGR